MLAIAPETVDLACLADKGTPLIGVEGKLSPQDASVQIGEKALEAITERVIAEVCHRLANPDKYRIPGIPLYRTE